MNTTSEQPMPSPVAPERRPYAPPELKRVELALAETLSEGCKLETDGKCMGPPVTVFEGGS